MTYNPDNMIGKNVCEKCGAKSTCSSGGAWSTRFRSHRAAYYCEKHHDFKFSPCNNKRGHQKWGCIGKRNPKNDLIELKARKMKK